MSNAMEPVWENVDQKSADELNCCKAHGGPFVARFDAIIFLLERDGVGIGTDQTAI